jgi:hypothetical protein
MLTSNFTFLIPAPFINIILFGNHDGFVRFEVVRAVTTKHVLWDVTPCGSGKNRRFGGTYRHHQHCGKKHWARINVSIDWQLKHTATMLKVQLLVFAYVVPCSLIICTLMMEVILSSETSLLTRARRCHFNEDGILHSRRRVNLQKQSPSPLVRRRTIPTERPPLVDEI